MNCTNWEERVALYAGGDLPPADAAEVEAHLGDCPGCQVFASGLKESLETLYQAHQDAIAPAHFAAVRARVMAELEGARLSWWRKSWVYGLAAAALAFFLIWTQRPGTPGKTQQMAVQTPAPTVTQTPKVPAPPVVHLAQVHRAQVHRRKLRPRIMPAAFPADPGPPVVVKLVTEDPDVIIYWITDKSGE